METILFLNTTNYSQQNNFFFDNISRYWNSIISYDHEERSYFDEQIKSLVGEGHLCNDKIDPEEIFEDLYSSDIILLLVDYPESEHNTYTYGKVVGFAFASYINRSSRGYCKLDILCGSGGGTGSELLQKISDIIFSTGIKKISIDSLKSAERFYLSRGFQIIQKTAYFTKMEKILNGGSKIKKQKKTKIKRRIKKHKTKKQKYLNTNYFKLFDNSNH